ncbi:MAG: DUF190 domain-containing protein [Bacteroidales bacterium]
MDSLQKITLVRIRIDSTEKFKRKPLYEVLLYAAKRVGVQDAIVLKGIMGVVSGKELYSHKSWEIAEKMPLLIEFTDTPENINAFLGLIQPYFEKVNFSGQITVIEGVALPTTT